MKNIFTCLFFVISFQINSQEIDYLPLATKGLNHLEADRYDSCLYYYLKALKISDHSPVAFLRVASCAYLASKYKLSDSLLKIASVKDWEICEIVSRDTLRYPEFRSSRKTKFMKRIQSYSRKEAHKQNINLKLKDQLEKIYVDDQKYRLRMDTMTSHNPTSLAYREFFKEFETMDSINLLKMKRILKDHGYPGKSVVGKRMSKTAWIVIQHAPLETQELYLPLIEQAALKNEMEKGNWAYLVDRIRMRKDLPQIYGSQIVKDKTTNKWKFYPLDSPDKVNELRKSVGLSTIEEYARIMGVEWPMR